MSSDEITRERVEVFARLAKKGWSTMTAAEQAEWRALPPVFDQLLEHEGAASVDPLIAVLRSLVIDRDLARVQAAAAARGTRAALLELARVSS